MSTIVAIHLDMKGVPPTFERLIGLLPVFRAAGYNALLVEWEDMFPWTVTEKFRCETAFSADELKRFHAEAAKLGLEIIPLVQCLGHMETPLREPEYRHLREVATKCDVLNPLAAGARELVEKMIDDVLALTPGLKYFHLGGDEAWTFGTHADTKAYIEKYGKGALYLHHVGPLLEKLLAKGIRPILWHDMMIHWEPAALKELSKKADLCVWGYSGTHATTKSHWQPKYIELFAKHEIRMWGATAYKGADGVSADLPTPERRAENCQSWADMGRQHNMVGLVATAWSRYSTNRMQNEPIDSALDVMILCGHILRDGKSPAEGLAHSLMHLEELGEKERFQRCREVVAEIADLRRGFWNTQQLLYEACALAEGDPRRATGGALTVFLHSVDDYLERAKKVESKMREAFAGSLAPVWIERYLAERFEPMRAIGALLHRKVKGLDPESYAAEFK